MTIYAARVRALAGRSSPSFALAGRRKCEETGMGWKDVRKRREGGRGGGREGGDVDGIGNRVWDGVLTLQQVDNSKPNRSIYLNKRIVYFSTAYYSGPYEPNGDG